MTSIVPAPHMSAELQISRDARFVAVNGRQTELSAAESALLACLVTHAGEPVSRARLHFALRSTSSGRAVPSRAVDFAIRRLRLKIEPDPSRPQVLFTVRGKGYRFVPPPVREARARTRGPAPHVAPRLARCLRQPGGLVQVLRGSAPTRGGLVRAVIDALGGPPVGGVLWASGRFDEPDQLAIAIATACGRGIPLDLSIESLLRARAPSLLVVDAIARPTAALAARMRAWRAAAPHLSWIVMGSRPLAIPHNGIHELGPTAQAHEAAQYIQSCSREARQVLGQLLASPGAVDVDLLGTRIDGTVLEEVDRTGMVRINGRDPHRRATLITGTTSTVAASLSTYDQRQGQALAQQLVETLVPEFRAACPWDLLLPPEEIGTRAARHHPLLMEAVDRGIETARSRDLHVAASAIALMCGVMPRALMGDWLRARGHQLLEQGPRLPELDAMVHLSLAWLEIPRRYPLLIGAPLEGMSDPSDAPQSAALDTAWRHIEAAHALATAHGLDEICVATTTLYARLSAARGRIAEALAGAHHARLVHQMSGQRTGRALATLTIAQMYAEQGNIHSCARWLAEAVPTFETRDRPGQAAQARVALGRMALALGNELQAALHLDSALAHGRSCEDLRLIAVAADLLSEVESRAGRDGEAVLRRREAHRAQLRLGDPRLCTMQEHPQAAPGQVG